MLPVHERAVVRYAHNVLQRRMPAVLLGPARLIPAGVFLKQGRSSPSRLLQRKHHFVRVYFFSNKEAS